MSLCRLCHTRCMSICHSNTSVTPSLTQSATLYCLSLCHPILSVGLSLCHSNCVSLCRSVQSNLSLCHSHCLSVCHSYAICRFTTDALSAALPLTCYLSFYTTCITRSVTRIACRSRASQRTVSRYSLSISISHAALIPYINICCSPTLYSPHTQLPPRSILPDKLSHHSVALSHTRVGKTQSVHMSHRGVGIGPGYPSGGATLVC